MAIEDAAARGLEDHAAGLLLQSRALEPPVLQDLDLDEPREQNQECADSKRRDDPQPPRVARIQGMILARTGTASAPFGAGDARKGRTFRNQAPRRAATLARGMARAVGCARSMSMI